MEVLKLRESDNPCTKVPRTCLKSTTEGLRCYMSSNKDNKAPPNNLVLMILSFALNMFLTSVWYFWINYDLILITPSIRKMVKHTWKILPQTLQDF